MKLKFHCFISVLIFFFSFYSGCSDNTANFIESFDGVPISYTVNGDLNPTLVFVHGWSANKNYWSQQVDILSKDFEVITIDLAGFGESGSDRKIWDMPSFGQDVSTVVNNLNLEKVILIGHSMGGIAIIEAAKIIPEKITGLVCVDIIKNIDRKFTNDQITKMVNNTRKNWGDIEVIRKQFFSPNSEEKQIKRAIESLPKDPPDYWWEILEEVFGWLSDDSQNALKNLKVPLMSINSDKGKTNIAAIRHFIPSYDAKIVKDTGHMVMWEKPEEFNELLREIIRDYQLK